MNISIELSLLRLACLPNFSSSRQTTFKSRQIWRWKHAKIFMVTCSTSLRFTNRFWIDVLLNFIIATRQILVQQSCSKLTRGQFFYFMIWSLLYTTGVADVNKFEKYKTYGKIRSFSIAYWKLCYCK